MSWVTTAILVVSSDDEPTNEAFAFTGHSAQSPMVMARLDGCDEAHVGGTKCAECDIYIGAFNYFDHDGWFAHLATLTWVWPHEVIAVVHGSDGEFVATWTPQEAR